MFFLMFIAFVVVYLVMSFLVTWLWATHYLPIHPKGNCPRIGCQVGYPSLYNQKDALESCVKTKAVFWGVFWPIGIFVFGLHMSSQGGFNNYLSRQAELKAKAERIEMLETEEAVKQMRIDSIIKELREEQKNKSLDETTSENWVKQFYELGSK